MIRKYANNILVGFLMLGALGIAATAIFTNGPSTVSALPAEQSVIVQAGGAQAPESSSVNNDIALKNKYPLVLVKNNIKIEVVATQVESGYFSADICFDFPSNDPAWSLGGPDNLKLSNGVAEIGVYSIDLIPDAATGELKKDENGKYVGRCDRVRFPISDGFELENLSITIGKLVTEMPESLDCNKAQAKLDSKNSGIKIKCVNEPGKGGVEIVEKPNEMDLVQAQDLVTDAFLESADGPWVFEIGTP